VCVDDGVDRYRGYRVRFFVICVSFVAVLYCSHSFLRWRYRYLYILSSFGIPCLDFVEAQGL